MSTPEGLSVVQRFDDLTEAELACGLLVAAGMQASLEEQQRFHGVSESLPIEGSVGLLVPTGQEQEARQLLIEARNSGGTQPSDLADEEAS